MWMVSEARGWQGSKGAGEKHWWEGFQEVIHNKFQEDHGDLEEKNQERCQKSKENQREED